MTKEIVIVRHFTSENELFASFVCFQNEKEGSCGGICSKRGANTYDTIYWGASRSSYYHYYYLQGHLKR